ncbi:hypothetical protein A5819_001298 [Enterococcus sp. 7E2_DIV0204]|uniref:helix-turn-helix domain-containing protein n=1 Tax=unclassified Enterococcus TaxID=2608891 RepID=UPI000A349ED1|nr:MULTISPECIES: helix-turn-helix domain-containing protein [unclassified Enterococcus]OTN88806.1 hypothetical protein A5819_001298 [Enterococcus sp. 7E2_DIV0204]OTP51270.1 hypothetical protein A5884_000465 [Enterococcus sp. 7D2_DIV0200]
MKIGTVNNNDIKELFGDIDTSVFSIKKLLNKSELDNTYDIIIISIHTDEDILFAIDWLVAMNSYKSIFSIITISEGLTESTSILLKIGANQVIKKLDTYQLMLKNLLDTLENIEKNLNNEENINKDNRSITINGHVRYLTKTEYKIFNFLYENKVVSYEWMSNEIWPDRVKNNKALIANSVFHLREKLKGSDYYNIKTIRSKGYMLTE